MSDLHAGSRVSPWPDTAGAEAMCLPDGSRFAGVRYMTECWNHFAENMPKVDLLVLNGDIIEGDQYRDKSRKLVAVSPAEQVQAAIELLAPVVGKAKEAIRVTGTEYHDGRDDPLSTLDEHFKIEEHEQMFDLELRGEKVLNVAHHPHGGAVMYKGTKMEKEYLSSVVSWAEGHTRKPTWIVRSHLHVDREYRVSDQAVVVICRCWQLPTAWATKKNHYGWQPDLGALFMTIDDDKEDAFRTPHGWKFGHMTYETPKSSVKHLEV